MNYNKISNKKYITAKIYKISDRYDSIIIFGATTKLLSTELKRKMSKPDERLTKLIESVGKRGVIITIIENVSCGSQSELTDRLQHFL